MEFEALLPVARWRGFGGKLNPQGLGFETFTWASGIAASTDKAGVIATTHCSVNHPLMACCALPGHRYLWRSCWPASRHRAQCWA
jgi:hypothetical protein